MGACETRLAGVDDEEVLLRGCKNADSELERWKVQALSARNPHSGDVVSATKDAMAMVVQTFVQGRELEVSSMIHGAGTYLVSLNQELSEMSLEELAVPTPTKRKVVIPLIYLRNASVDNSSLQRYSLNSTLRIQVGPHAGFGPDMMLLQLQSHSECTTMALVLCASSRHLQNAAGWERQRLMDDESVATTMIRSVERLKDPQGLAHLLLSKQRAGIHNGIDLQHPSS